MIEFSVLIATVSVVAFFVFLCATFWHWLFRRKYTREKYAFSATASVLSLFVIVIASVLGNAPFWELIFIAIDYFRTGEVREPVYELGNSQLLTLLFLCVMYSWLVLSFFKLWNDYNGKISQDTYYLLNSNQEQSLKHLLNEAFIEFSRIKNRQPDLEPFSPSTSPDYNLNLNEFRKLLPWHERARALAKIYKNSLEINDEDWRQEHRFWLAHHRDHECLYAIKCEVDLPDSSKIEDFIDYLKGMNEFPQKILIVVQNDCQKPEIEFEQVSIEIITQDEILNNLVDFAEYKAKIKARVSHEKLKGSHLTLIDTYVEPRFKNSHQKEEHSSRYLESEIMSWLEDPSDTQIAILGEYGQGKSTVALMQTYHLLEKGLHHLKRIPILIELRGKSPSTMSSGELLGAWCHAYGVNSRHLQALHEAGKLLIIFDGFDEMSLMGTPSERLKHFRTLWEFNHSQSKLIFTGRPNLFLDTDELKQALGIRENSSGKPMCKAWYVEKFNVVEINEALRKNPDDIRKAITKAVEDNPRLFDIASRPSLLHVISVLWDDELSMRVKELTSAEIMGRFLRATLQRQEEKAFQIEQENKISNDGKNISSNNYMVLNPEERYFFMIGIAVHMIQNDESNQISLSELNKVVEKLAVVCPKSISLKTSLFFGGSSLSINERLEESEDFLGRLQDDIRTCGLIVKDVEDSSFKFSHKSFLEYLVADFAQQDHAKKKSELVTSIKTVINTSCYQVLVNDVIRGYFGELLVFKSDKKISWENHVEASKVLLDEIFKPNKITKKVWSISLSIINLNFVKDKSIKVLSDFYEGYLCPLFFNGLNSFMKSRIDRKKNMSVLLLSTFAPSLLSFSVLLFFRILDLETAISILNKRDVSDFDRPFSILASVSLVPAFLSSRLPDLIFRQNIERVKSQIWIETCLKQNCKIEDLYQALGGNRKNINIFRDDPVGIIYPQRADEDYYKNKSVEELNDIICDFSTSIWNKSVAAWILASRHSEFGRFLLSEEFDGRMPPRKISNGLKRKNIMKVGRKLDLSDDEIVEQLDSLNDYLGWDLHQGWQKSKV